ncbi:hypothetical protein B9T34_04705 [Acinetobacter sp. ANC 3813]|nr:hypothetical protein B9T34_04705 [Acinetobacter sp. ANC 3813]
MLLIRAGPKYFTAQNIKLIPKKLDAGIDKQQKPAVFSIRNRRLIHLLFYSHSILLLPIVSPFRNISSTL